MKKRVATSSGGPQIAPRRLGLELLEARCLLSAQPIITEFVASNDTTLNDGFGDDSDWLEIYNAGDLPVNLQGYHLTDNAANPTKWAFTAETILNPKEYLLVFASGDDTIDPEGYWHTGFRFSAGGEFVGLADPSGVMISSFGAAGEDYPPQATDVSYGLPGPTQVETLIDSTDSALYLVPTDDAVDGIWTSLEFDALAHGFSVGAYGIGYELSSLHNYDPYLGTHLINSSGQPRPTTAYIRSEFHVADVSEIADLSLSVFYDDGFALHLNGEYLFGDFEPEGSLNYQSVAAAARADALAVVPTEFSLNQYLHLLKDGANVLAIQALNDVGSSDMLLALELTALTGDMIGTTPGYLAQATPGAVNSQIIDMGPIFDDVEFAPDAPTANDAITITASLAPSTAAVDFTSPAFYYRVNFGSEVQTAFADNGVAPDTVAGDGVYAAQIPASAFSEGDMVRWYMTARDVNGFVSRAPRFDDPNDSAQYFGLVIPDASASTDVPALYWYVQDAAAAATRTGTRASIYYRGAFYDNVQVDLHGQSTALPEFIKKSFDFDANHGEKFDIGDPTGKHSDFNLLTNYADQSKLRNTIAYASHGKVGGATHLAYPVTVHRNGTFYGLYDLVEEGDGEYLRRLGLDANGALYKVNNDLEDNQNGAFNEVDKITRLHEGRSDFQEVIEADDLTGAAARIWYFDNLDVASVINFLAAQNAIQNWDFGHKNMYWYRDTEGTELWQVLPWDVDLSYGHLWGRGADPPYFNNTLFTQENPIAGWNDIFQNIVNSNLDPRLTQMYKRRIRSISDQLFGSAGSPVVDSWAYQQFAQWDALVADEAVQDMARWGVHPNFTHTPAQAVDQIQSSFISARRSRLNSFAGTQSDVDAISFGAIKFAPASLNQNEEYIVLTNHDPTFAADLSNWSIAGAVNHLLKPGTVIPPGESMYVVADVQGFQGRTSGPRGGQQLFIQGNYSGRLPNGGGSLTLLSAEGVQIDSTNYVGVGNGGDFNNDGDYDGRDFLMWQRGFGVTGGANPANGDADEDGDVDQEDFNAWNSNYGTLPAVAAPIAASAMDDDGMSRTHLARSLAALAYWSRPESPTQTPFQREFVASGDAESDDSLQPLDEALADVGDPAPSATRGLARAPRASLRARAALAWEAISDWTPPSVFEIAQTRSPRH